MRVCRQCGARYEDEAAFCPMDGSPLGELSSPSASTPAGGPTFAPPPSASGSVLRWQPSTRAGSGPHGQAASSSSWSAPQSGSYASAPVVGGGAAAVAVAEEQEETLLGVVLGDRYRVDERIGAGGMGLVYRATHVLIGRKLAIKLLRRRFAAQQEVAARFVQEARLASSVKHPNVVDIIDYGTTPQGSPYYVMEFLAGHSLAGEIKQGPIEPRRALGIATQIAHGLAAAHLAGIIHRDLKPDNVFVVPADVGAPEQVKILDFGIARVAGRKTRLTAAGAVVGTPEYMSPEQARGDELDVRSDIYALGVVLFELLTGRVPLSGDSMVGTLTKQVFELPPPIREIDPRFAGYPSIEAALARLLAKNRDERPATALDAASLLATAAANDLEPEPGVTIERREQAVLAGWSQPSPAVMPEPDRPRRSTIMIGSGAITSAHSIVEAEGPRTGSFAAKQVDEAQLPKRPSVIVTDAPAGQGPFRPARVLQVTPAAPPPAPPSLPGRSPLSTTPTPPHGSAPARDEVPARRPAVEVASRRSAAEPPRRSAADGDSRQPAADVRLGKRPRGGLRRRHLPLILVGLGAAIFAALVTIGFVQWLKRREARQRDATSVKGSPLDDLHATRPQAHDWPNTHVPGAVEGTAREIDHRGIPLDPEFREPSSHG